jgi:hypothetical protein
LEYQEYFEQNYKNIERRVWVRQNINSMKVVCCGAIRYNKNAAEVKRFRVAFLIGLAVWLWSALPQALIYCLMGSRMLRLFAMN